MGRLFLAIVKKLASRFRRPPKPTVSPKAAQQAADAAGKKPTGPCVGSCPVRGADPIKPNAKLRRQMEQRGWTDKQIEEAVQSGKQFPATNNATGGAATRYVHPQTGQSVVIDNTTGGVIHVGGPGFVY